MTIRRAAIVAGLGASDSTLERGPKDITKIPASKIKAVSKKVVEPVVSITLNRKTVSFKQLFEELGSCDQFPVEKFSDSLPSIFRDFNHASNRLCHLDFSGIEQLTDEVFYILQDKLTTEQKLSVVQLDLTGCVHISDAGVRIFAEAFVNLTLVSMVGLTDVSARALIYLRDYCKNLTTLKMDATGLSCLPREKFPFSLSVEGCPIYNNLQNETTASKSGSHATNLVIMVLESCPFNVLNWLQTGNKVDVSPEQHVIYSPAGWRLGDQDMNVIELHCDAVCYSPFIQPRSLYLVVINLDEISNPQLHSMRCIDYIRGAVPQAPILVLALSEVAESNEKFRDLNSSLEAMFKDQRENMEEHLQKEHYSKSVNKDFPNQKRFVQSIETSRPENFMIHLLQADLSNNGQNKHFSFAVLQETKLRDNAEKYIQRWMDDHMKDAKDALDRVNKLDINEVSSMKVWPEALTYVLLSSIVLLREEDDPNKLKRSLREHLKDYRYIIKLQHFDFAAEKEPAAMLDTLAKIPQPSEDVEKIASVSRLGNAVWLWVKAVKRYYEDVAPMLSPTSQKDQWTTGENTSMTSVEAVRFRLQENLRHLMSNMYTWLPKQMDRRFHQFTTSLDTNLHVEGVEEATSKKQPPRIIRLHDLMKQMKYEPYGRRRTTYEEALKYLSITGRVLFFPQIEEKFIVLDMPWFSHLMNYLIDRWKEPTNNDLVFTFPRATPMAERPQLVEFLKQAFSSELDQDPDQLSDFIDTLLHLGILLQTLSPQASPVGEFPLRYLCPWFALRSAPEMRLGVETTAVAHSVSQFTREYFPDVFSSDFDGSDVNVKFSVKFRIGMPSNLFPRIVANILRHCRCLCVWDQGVYLYHGTVDVLMRHNLHGTLASSSIDIEARTAYVPHHGTRLVEYIWSVLSDYITIIEGLSFQYPNTHHKLRHYCRGECYKELSKENTFSPTEIACSWERNVTCSKCKRYQMSDKDWTYIIGRQFMFPAHAFSKNGSCDKCWRHRRDIENVWNHQCSLYPSFSMYCFRTNSDISGLEACHRGNLLIPPVRRESSTNSTAVGCMRTLRPLKHSDLELVNLLVLQPQGVRMKIVRALLPATAGNTAAALNAPDDEAAGEGDLATRPGSGTSLLPASAGGSGYVTNALGEAVQEVMCLELTTGELTFTPEVVEFTKGSRRSTGNVGVSCGDLLTLKVMGMRTLDDADTNESLTSCKVKLCINHHRVEKFYVPEKCYVLFEVDTVNSPTEQQVAGIVHCPTFPLVTARYFRPGMLLLYKTGIGAMWNVGVVKSTERGKLRVKHADDVTSGADGRDRNAERMYAPWSEELAPLGLYPDEMNAIVYTKHVKSMESWYNYLKSNLNYSAAPYGLFPRLQEDFRYKPLPLLTAFSRTCTMTEHCPWNYLRVGITIPQITANMTPVFPLPLEVDVKSLTMRNRSKLQSSKGQALYPLCPGFLWANIRDMHPLNVAPIALDDDDYRDFRQEYHLQVITLLESLSKQKAGTNVMLLQNIDLCLPQVDPNFDRQQLGMLLTLLLKCIRDDYLQRRIMAMSNLGIAFQSWTGQLDFEDTPSELVRNTSFLNNEDAPSFSNVPNKLQNSNVIQQELQQQVQLLDSQQWTSNQNQIPQQQQQLSKRPSTGRRNQKLQFLRTGYESGTCESHLLSKKILTLQSLGAYNHCVEHVRLQHVKVNLAKFPSEALLQCKFLSRLELSDCHLQDMNWISHLPETLISLNLQNNAITKIVPEILNFKGGLRSLFFTGNPITQCPSFLGGMQRLHTLCLSNTLVETLPESIGELPSLRNFFMEKSLLRCLPDSFGNLKNLNVLKLGGVPYSVAIRGNALPTDVTEKQWSAFVNDWRSNGLVYSQLSKDEKDAIFSEFDERKVSQLTQEQTTALARHLFRKYPRLCMDQDQEFPPQIMGLKDLRVLVINYTGIKRVPNGLRVLKRMTKLIVNDNLLLEAVEADVGLLDLDVIALKNCPALKTPPPEIIKQGMLATIGYLKRLASGKVNCYRTKLMLVGLDPD